MVFILLITGHEGIFMGLELSMYQGLLTMIFKNCFSLNLPSIKETRYGEEAKG
jgi:hypothetical protein